MLVKRGYVILIIVLPLLILTIIGFAINFDYCDCDDLKIRDEKYYQVIMENFSLNKKMFTGICREKGTYLNIIKILYKGEVLFSREVYRYKGRKRVVNIKTENSFIEKWYYDNGQIEGIWHYKYAFEKKRLKHGSREVWLKNGLKFYEGNYIEGKKEEGYYRWYPNGRKYIVGNYKNDLPNGNWSYYTEDGSKVSEVIYNAGKILRKELYPKYDSIAITYFDNGKIKSLYNFQDGKLHGKYIIWDEKSALIIEKGAFNNGVREGEFSTWESSFMSNVENFDGYGLKKIEGSYNNGKKDGIWTYWNSYSGTHDIYLKKVFKDSIEHIHIIRDDIKAKTYIFVNNKLKDSIIYGNNSY